MVEKLYLYGSYSKENIHQSSDIDLLIILNKNLINQERANIVYELQKFLKDEFQIPIDILDFTHALENLDIEEMENIITIV